MMFNNVMVYTLIFLIRYKLKLTLIYTNIFKCHFSFFWTTKINLNVILTYTNFKFKILLQEYNSPILKLYFLNISFYLLFLVILFDNALPLNNQHDSTSFKWIMQRMNLLLLLILRYVVAIVLEKPTLKFLIIRMILAQFKVFLFYN